MHRWSFIPSSARLGFGVSNVKEPWIAWLHDDYEQSHKATVIDMSESTLNRTDMYHPKLAIDPASGNPVPVWPIVFLGENASAAPELICAVLPYQPDWPEPDELDDEDIEVAEELLKEEGFSYLSRRVLTCPGDGYPIDKMLTVLTICSSSIWHPDILALDKTL